MGNPSVLKVKGSLSILSLLVRIYSSVYSSLIEIKALHDCRKMTYLNQAPYWMLLVIYFTENPEKNIFFPVLLYKL